MKRRYLIAMLVAATVVQGTAVMAQDKGVDIVHTMQMEEVASEKNQYVASVGQVTEVIKEDGKYSILVASSLEEIRYIINQREVIINAETMEYLTPEQIKVGMEVTVVMPKHAPMTLSLPPMSSSQVAIIVNSSKAFVEEGYFDETLTNESNTLKLNIEKNTYIVNTKGERRVFTAEDIVNQNAVIIYTTSTRSIPALTTPNMVLILPNDTQDDVEVDEPKEEALERQASYEPLREKAQSLGYTITWDNEKKVVTLTKEEKVCHLYVGKAEYQLNGEKRLSEKEVKIENQRVYVPSEIFKSL